MSERPDLDIAPEPAYDPALDSAAPPAPEAAARPTSATAPHAPAMTPDGVVDPTDRAAARPAPHRDPASGPAAAFSEPLGAKPPGGRRRRERPPLTGAVTIVRPPVPPVVAAPPTEAVGAPDSPIDDASAATSTPPTPTVEPPAELSVSPAEPERDVPQAGLADGAPEEAESTDSSPTAVGISEAEILATSTLEAAPLATDEDPSASTSDPLEAPSSSADLAPASAASASETAPEPETQTEPEPEPEAQTVPAAAFEVAPSDPSPTPAAPAAAAAAPAPVVAAELRPAAVIPAEDAPESESSGQLVTVVPESDDLTGRTAAADVHDEDAKRGRRRAASRHRNSRSVRLPTPLAFFLHYGLPIVVLVVLYIVTVIEFSYAPATTGPLPQPVVLVASLITIALTFVVARRLGLSSLGAVVAAALATIAPAAIDSNAAGVPEHLAVIGLLGSVAFIAARRQLIVALPAAALLAAVAGVLSPIALVAVPFLAFRAAAGWRRRRGRRPVIAAAIVFVAAFVIGTLIVGVAPLSDAPFWATPSFGTVTLQEWLVRDPIGTAVALVAVGLGFTNRRLRLLSFTAVALLALSVWPDGDAAVRYTVLLSPTFAVLIGSAADLAVEAIGRHAALPRLAGIVGTAALALAIVVAVTLSSIEVRTRAFAEGDPSTAPTPPAASTTPTPTDTGPVPDTSAEAVAERTAMGIQLLRNPRLSVSEVARRLLADGSVDARISIVLGQILSEHTVTVADFPVVDDEDPSVRRQLLVTEMDGATLATGGASMSSLTAYLSGLTGSFAVQAVSVDASGVLATFSPDDGSTPSPIATP
ncbi:hypothetical protein [Naasia lichenicola]|uniref:Uncharacterized protein n=1 Tax=Naasia lichenicola TaxID=2565933 RepID=A0A4S4FF66_9MICO|nr:hypothetical protein [Naasia lichenicola]THG28753.1 hypothetical protein E6C64_18425 [Naasia lichenicola]